MGPKDEKPQDDNGDTQEIPETGEGINVAFDDDSTGQDLD